jgi:hypothetical protein
VALGSFVVRLQIRRAESTAGMSERRYRKPNALKHGGFSRTELLPWEDVNEFEELHRGLKEEFEPRGPLQEDCVYTILSCMWRKRRVREKRNLDTADALDRVENRVLWEEPPPLFETRLDDKVLELRLLMLPPEFSAHLREKVPPGKFESSRSWIVELKKEVDSVLLPMVRKRGHDPDAYLATAAAFLTDDRVLEDLAIEERLDAAIDRATKRFYQLKLARQFNRPSLPELVGSKVLAQLEGPNTIARRTKE